MSSKQDIISEIYFDRGGFGSKATTLKDAREKDKSITMADVNEFFKENVEEKRKPRGENSFVAPHAYFEFQLDLFFIGKNDFENEQKFRIGLVLIDIFSKYAVVIPINSREPQDILSGIMEGMQKMGDKKPKMIYSDEERSLIGSELQDYFKKEGIKLHTTRGHPAFAERFIRTFKDMLFKRVENDEKKGKQVQWTDYIFEILLTYQNKMVSSATKMTPKDARMKKNELDVKMNISLQAKSNRKYPAVEVSDKVKLMRKKAITEKERTSTVII